MTPRPGGEAAKFGERYEGRWTTRQLLYVLLGQVESVTVEDIGEIGLGVEFTLRREGKVEVHQVNPPIDQLDPASGGSVRGWRTFIQLRSVSEAVAADETSAVSAPGQ